MGRNTNSASNVRQRPEDIRRQNDRHNGHRQGGGGERRTNAQTRASFKGKSESFFKSIDARELIKEKENENKQQRMVIEIQQDKQRAAAAAAVNDEEMDDEGEVIRVGDSGRNKRGPAVYVTGLSTVKIRGDKIHVAKKFQKTIHNENAVIEIDKRVASKPTLESKVSFPPQSIRIKIDNDKALADRITRPETKYRESEIDMDMDDEPVTSAIQSTVTIVKKQPVISSEIYDPHGYRLQISNLHPKVTEEDIRELFGDIGPVKRARFLDKGVAEVVYVRLDDAKQAIAKYHKSELDGRAMIIELVDKHRTSSHVTESPSQRVEFKKTIYSNGESNSRVSSTHSPSSSASLRSRIDHHDKSITLAGSTLSDKFKSLTKEKFVLPESVALMSNKNPNNKVDRIDPSLVTQTLFNSKPASSSPVTFTVKI